MIVLVLGGTRSGKSAVAEAAAARLAGEREVAYVATARVDPNDADHAARVDAHRRRRPERWRTLECPDPAALPGVVTATSGVLLLDSLGTWVSSHPELVVDPGPLVDAILDRAGDSVVVSEEVGLSVHPATEAGRRFADALGTANQAVSLVADHTVLVVAGRALPLPAPGVLPW